LKIQSRYHQHSKIESVKYFYVFLLCIIFEVARVQELFPPLGYIYFQSIIWLVAIFGVLSNVQSRIVLKKLSSSPQFRIVFFLFVWAVITIPTAIWPSHSYKIVTSSYWKLILLFVLIIAYSHYKDAVSKMLWAYFVGAIIISIYGLTGLSTNHRMEIADSYDPNDLALILAIIIPYSIFCMLHYSWKYKILWISGFMTLMVPVIRSESRGGFLSLIAIMVTSIYYIRKISFKQLMFALFIVLIGAITLTSITGEGYWKRMETIIDPAEDYNVTARSGRIQVWKRGIDIIMENPLCGVGIGNFATAEGEIHVRQGGSGKWSAAHNSFIQIAAELGILGLLAYCAIILYSLRGLKKRINVLTGKGLKEKSVYISSSLVASWVAFLVGGFFLSQAYSNCFYFLAGLSLVTEHEREIRDLS